MNSPVNRITPMTTIAPPTERKEFLELTLPEMDNSIATIETCLSSFKYGSRCHWGLSHNVDRIMRLSVSLDISKRLFKLIQNNPLIAGEYHTFRDRAVATLTRFSKLSSKELMNYRSEFFTLSRVSKSIQDLFIPYFKMEDNKGWYCTKSRDTILEGYFLEKSINPAPGLDIKDLKDLLRFIIQVENNLMYVYAKELKEIRRHPLSKQWDIINTATRTIIALPDNYIPLTLVSDGVNLDIKLKDKITNKVAWSSTLELTRGVDSKFIRAYRLEVRNERIFYNEVSDYRDIVVSLPKNTKPKQEQEYRYRNKKQKSHDAIEAQLRAEFAKLLN